MHPAVQTLLELQQTDAEIRRLSDEVAALPRRVAAIEDKLAHVKTQLEKARAAIKADESTRRKYEGDIQAQQQKIGKYRDQSLEVKTNEQYKALMHEINFAEQEIRLLEDRILELMLQADVRHQEVAKAEAELKARTAEVEKEKAEARSVTERDEQALAELRRQREQLRGGVDADMLRHYDRVLRLRGTAIAEAREQRCTACQVMLRPQSWVDLAQGSVFTTCDSCHRILFAVPAPKVEEEPKTKRRKRGGPDDRAWYFLPGEELFVAVVNGMRESAMHRFDAVSGRKAGEPLYRDGDFQTAFAYELEQGIRLSAEVDKSQVDLWEEIPEEFLDILRQELRIAQVQAEQASAAQ